MRFPADGGCTLLIRQQSLSGLVDLRPRGLSDETCSKLLNQIGCPGAV
jgi:hypothetical protein